MYLVTFATQFDAIYANQALRSGGVDVRLLPVPRAVSASCGSCVCISQVQEEVQSSLAQRRLRWEHIYARRGEDWVEIA